MFLEELPEKERMRFVTLFQRMADTGRIHNEEQFKKEQDKIYAFKRGQMRIGSFQIEERWLLTHGFIKKCSRWPKAELDRAERIMNEHLDCERRENQKRRSRT